MRTTNFLTVIALAAALLFSACNKDEPQNTGNDDNTDPNQTEEFESTAIVFSATVDGGWEGVSSVAVMIDGTVKEYSVSVSDADNTSATLSSDDPHYWLSSDDITVTAWWPYTEGETTPPDVVVNADQSTADGFVGSYFISAEDQTVAYDNSTLTFTNRTARVTVILTDYIVGMKSVKLTNLSTENGNPAEIVPYEYDKENHTYVVYVAPQTVAQGTAFITYEFDNDVTFIDEMPEVAEWSAGEEYTYTLSLDSVVPDYSYDATTYTVYRADGLLAWNEAVQNNLSLNCTLAADIDLTGIDYEWWVGNEVNAYYGTFDGGGHTITGLTVSKSGSDYVGLIGVLDSPGVVQNLTLDNVSITGSQSVGGVVGYNASTVTNCSVSGSVSGSDSVGGVVGNNEVGTVTNCSVSGSVSGSDYVGGVVGNNTYTLTACYNASGSVSGNYYVGAVVGYNASTVTACYNASGSVSGSSYVGGVVGSNTYTVTACYNASSSVSGNYVGGVVGWNNSTVTACYWSDYNGNGIGYDYSGTGNTTKVDGSDVTWSDAVEGMNTALQSRSSDWRYELLEGNDLPTLKKNE